MDDINIKEAELQDAEAIFVLAEKLATSFKVKKECFELSYKSILKNDSSIVFKAEIDDKIIGYCLGFLHPAFYANGSVAWLEELYVEAALRKKGVGKVLMSRFENWARDKGCVLCALATRRASEFYTSIGYEESAVYFKKNL